MPLDKHSLNHQYQVINPLVYILVGDTLEVLYIEWIKLLGLGTIIGLATNLLPEQYLLEFVLQH